MDNRKAEIKSIKPKKKMKKLDDRQLLIIMICVVAVIVIGYAARGIYYNYTGAVRTEVVNYVSEEKKINVNGIVIRDEGSSKENGTSSLLKKAKSGSYSPTVFDGESVAKGQSIAYIFSSEEAAANFREIEEISNRLSLLGKLQDTENIGYLDLTMLNSEIASSVSNMISECDRNELSDLDQRIDDLCYKITSKQIITGEDLNFKSEINELNKRKKALESSVKGKKSVVAPKAGYFVSKVDGYEQLFDYKAIAEDGLTVSQIEKLQKKKPKDTENYFGKIISEHAWYYAFNASFKDASTLKVNNSVTVSFPDKNVSDVIMTVKSVKRDGDSVAIVLKCMTMNENMLYLRNERAVITIESYDGIKISNSALKKYKDDIMGVYAYVGNVALFKPVKIIYSTGDYVIVEPVVEYYDKNADGSEPGGDIETTAPTESSAQTTSPQGEETTNPEEGKKVTVDQKNILKAYDRIIVKGRNLYDGKVIG